MGPGPPGWIIGEGGEEGSGPPGPPNSYSTDTSCRKSLPALVLRVLASLVISKTIHQRLNEKTRTAVPPRWQQQGRRPLVDLPIQLERYGLPHGKKVSSVDAIVCIATIAHSQWKSLVTWTDLSNNGHIDEHVSESATSV